MTKREKRKWKRMHPKPPTFELGQNDDKDEDDHDDDDDDDSDDKRHHKVGAGLSKLESICFLIAHAVQGY